MNPFPTFLPPSTFPHSPLWGEWTFAKHLPKKWLVNMSSSAGENKCDCFEFLGSMTAYFFRRETRVAMHLGVSSLKFIK